MVYPGNRNKKKIVETIVLLVGPCVTHREHVSPWQSKVTYLQLSIFLLYLIIPSSKQTKLKENYASFTQKHYIEKRNK